MKQYGVSRRAACAGFTLVELMVACAISLLLVMGVVSFFASHRKSMRSMEQMNHLNQSVRIAADQVVTDIRNAGYGAPKYAIGSWVTWMSGITGIITIVKGAEGEADVLHVVGAFEPPRAHMNAVATSNKITLQAGQATNFNTTNRKLVFIGQTEVARITNISGDTLTLSSNPSNSANLNLQHVAGETVELVKVITYSQGMASTVFPRTRFLKRWDNVTTVGAEWHKMLASNIENFTIDGSSPRKFNITIIGRSAKVDPTYNDPVRNDKYRRLTYSVNALIRQP